MQSSPINVALDFSGLGKAVVDALMTGFQNLASPLPLEFEKWLLTSLQGVLSSQDATNVLTHVPVQFTSESGDVMELWRAGLPIELSLMALVLTIQGYRVSRGTADLLEVVFRTGFLLIIGGTILFWSDLIFKAINAGSDSVAATPLDIRTENLPNDLNLGLMLIIALIFAVFAWIKGAVGVVFIKVLLVSAPYILTLSALPMLEGLGKWWVEEFTTWTLRAFMVALTLRLGLGVGITNTGGIQFLFAIVSFWLAYTMDTRIRRFSVGAWGSVSQLGLFSRGAKLMSGAFGSGAIAAPAAAAASATP